MNWPGKEFGIWNLVLGTWNLVLGTYYLVFALKVGQNYSIHRRAVRPVALKNRAISFHRSQGCSALFLNSIVFF